MFFVLILITFPSSYQNTYTIHTNAYSFNFLFIPPPHFHFLQLLLEKNSFTSSSAGLLIALCVFFVGLYLLSFWAINKGYLAPEQGILALVAILVIGIGIAGLVIHKRDASAEQVVDTPPLQ
jgi:hypothetical protein